MKSERIRSLPSVIVGESAGNVMTTCSGNVEKNLPKLVLLNSSTCCDDFFIEYFNMDFVLIIIMVFLYISQ